MTAHKLNGPLVKWCLSVLLILLVAACAAPKKDSTADRTSNSGRYTEANDGLPLERPATAASEPVPQAEPLSRYGNHSPYTVNGKSYRVLESNQGYRARGEASWYGRKFHGHTTSSGEVYDMFQFSAAHRELPLPSFVEVTNLNNGRSVVVRVNDRGPFHGNRLIDLSFAAAEKLDMITSGTAPVEVRVIGPLAAAQTAGKVWLQVGAYGDRKTADNIQQRLRANNLGDVTITRIRRNNRLLWRVRVGPYAQESAIRQANNRIRQLGLGQSVRVGESG